MSVVHYELGRHKAACKPHIYDNMTRVSAWVTCARCKAALVRMKLERSTALPPRRVIVKPSSGAAS